MAERLATRAVPRQEIPPQDDTDKVFEDIVSNYDQEYKQENQNHLDVLDAQGATPLTEAEYNALKDIEAGLEDNSSAKDDSVDTGAEGFITPVVPIHPEPLPVKPTPPTPPAAQPIKTTPVQQPIESTPPTPTVTSSSEFSTAPGIRFVNVDQSRDAKDFAKDIAKARVDREVQQGGLFKRAWNKAWKGHVARHYYENRYAREAEKEIIDAQDVLVGKEASAEKRRDALRATLERFGHEYGEELIERNSDNTLEQRTEHEQDSEYARAVKEAVRMAVDQNFTNQEITEQFARINETFRRQNPNDTTLGKGIVERNNGIEAVKAAREAIEHGESLNNVIEGMKIITGEARTGARTEARKNAADKAVEWFGKRKATAWVPEGVIAAATSVTSFVVRVSTSKTAAVLTAPLTMGFSLVAPALIGGVREHSRVRADQAQHDREMAEGRGDIDKPELKGWRKLVAKITGADRDALEKKRYNTISAEQAINDLRAQHQNILMDDANRQPGETKDQAIQAALDALAAIEVHREASNERSKDFVGFDSTNSTIPEQRFQLMLARAELKAALASELDAATRARLNLDANESLDAIVESTGQGAMEALNTDEKGKDRARRNMKWRRVGLMAGIAVVGGVVIGSALQEGVAAFTSTNGVVEQAWGGGGDVYNGEHRQTVLERIVHGERLAEHHGPDPEYAATEFGEHAKIEVSNDHTLERSDDGTYKLVDAEGKTTVEGLNIGEDGSMPDETKNMLESKGMHVDPAPVEVPVEKREQVSLDQFMERHKGETTTIHHDRWYDRNTPGIFEDIVERELTWGGVNGTGIAENGDFQMSIDGMTEDTFTGDQVTNPIELAKQGKLKLEVYASDRHQSTPFQVDIKPVNVTQTLADGTTKTKVSFVASMPQGSPAGKLFSVGGDGKAVFNGRFAEVAELRDIDQNGVQNIRPVATYEGPGNIDTLEDTVISKETYPGYVITTNGYDTIGTATELPPVVPITTRRSLTPLKPRTPRSPERPGAPNNYNYYPTGETGGWYPEYFADLERDRMPELRRDPAARIRLADGLKWHHDLIKSKDAVYAQEIENLVGTMPNMASIDNSTNLIVPILVGANMEHDNIYRNLSLFAHMPASWKAESQLVLHVNWIDSKENDPAEKAKIEKTKSEIQRAMRDFPDLKISQFESVWSQEKLDRGEYGDRLIGHAAQRLVDVSMASARQAIDAGRMDPDHDLIMWKVDADGRGIGRDAGPKILKKMKENPEVDTFSGGVRWGTERYGDLPGLGFVMTFMEVYRITAQRAHIKGFQSTFGVNAGARMATLAAVGGIGHYSDQKQSAPDDGAWGERISIARNANSPGTGTSTYGASGGQGANNDYHMHIGGVSIDTDASRFEKAYTSGEPITAIWTKVNENGYQPRTAGLKQGQKEDLKRNADEVITRIEDNMSDLIGHWTVEAPQVAAALAIMLPGAKDLGGTPAYRIVKNSDGSSAFSLTPQGKKWLVNRLRQNSGGKRDHYGDRQARQLYGKTKRLGKGRIPTKQSPSRMVAGWV